MKVDDSFKKPGSVPFKWEIRPGVPKLQTAQTQSGCCSAPEKQHRRKQKPETPRTLKPPPAGLCILPPTEPQTRNRTRSVGSSPRAFSDRSRLARPDVVSSAGCFLSPIGKLKNVTRGGSARSLPRPDYYSDLEMSSRWSGSSRKSGSPDIPSHRSSPRPVFDAEWAGFGLF